MPRIRDARPVGGDGSLEIRPASPEDEPAMLGLELANADHHASVDPKRWRALTRDQAAASRRRRATWMPAEHTLLAVLDGRVVGMLELSLRRSRDPDAARIPGTRADVGLVVDPGLRGRGIGTALLGAAEDWARRHGADRMSLDVVAANTGARRLYERLGYETYSLDMDKPLVLADAPELPPGAPAGPVARDAAGEPIPTLEGGLVRLRPIRPEDRTALIAVLNDETVASIWDSRGAEHSADELLAGDDGWTVWAIEVDGEFAGSIQASEESDADYRHAGIDIFLSSAFQGRGLGADAVRTLGRYLLEERGHHRLTIDPAASNERAIRAYEKVGFRPVGVMRRYERGRDGTFHDGLLMDLLAGELR